MDNQKFSRIRRRIESKKDSVVEFQTQLTALPALSPENGGDGEAKKASLIKDILLRLEGGSLEEVHAPDDRVSSGYRPNLFFKIKGKSDAHTVWIMSHMDVVPPGESSLWETDPYRVVEKDGKLFGRGTEDNQQGIVSSILAVEALLNENVVPPYDVGLAIVADEEVGSKYGIEYVLEKRPDIFSKEDLIIIPDAGHPEGLLIEVAEKSILWIKCETLGKQTHGSTPEKGINAYRAAAKFIVKMEALYTLFDESDPLFDPPISTFEPTKKELNVENINTIPGKDISYFDCRVLPKYPLKDIQMKIREWADEIEKQYRVKINVSYSQEVEAPPPTPVDAPVAVALQRAIQAVTGKQARTIGIGGGTVAASFRQTGLPAVCWCTLDDTMHGPNEYCKIENVINDAVVFAHVFLQE